MIVQHILTKDIFDAIFSNQQFHKYNSIAKTIDEITNSFFTKEKEMELTKSIRGYYQTIINSSKSISDHRQKQSFLKTIYQEFYKAYNPSKADRQGVEYTPIEIVNFMIEATDLLLFKHFGQNLQDKGVEILDPCTGTGIFISELLYHIAHCQDFEHKFANEIFCNEIDILPYYIANLNIEYIRAQIKGNYKEFNNIVLVDTLNNIAPLTNSQYDSKTDLFSELSRQAFNENNRKIAEQNTAKLKVIIGNPPYNSNQQNENDNNKNFAYPHLDKRIKDTYIAKSTAQKTKQFDMYKRFIRWAGDRMGEEKGGIIAFITNNAYLDAKQDDGFRACIAEEFDYAYFVDLKGNSRLHGEEAKKQGENVFNIRVGCGIMFLVKNGDNLIESDLISPESKKKHRCQIKYLAVDDYTKKEAKLTFLNRIAVKIADNTNLLTYKELIGNFTNIVPSQQYQWLGQVKNNWQELIPLINKEVKNNKIGANAIFKTYSLGVATNRDKWVYDFNKNNLTKKVVKFIEIYHQELERNEAEIIRINNLKTQGKGKKNDGNELTAYYLEHRQWEYSLSGKIKWSETLKSYLKRNAELTFDESCIKQSIYRPFCKKYLYYSHELNDRPALFKQIFPNDEVKNFAIVFHLRHHYQYITDKVVDLATDGGFCVVPLNIYPDGKTKMPNLTDYGRKIFTDKYQNQAWQVTDEQIFYYCYAVLNSQQYRQEYRQNLKVDLPRIPLLENFWQLAELGKALADLHIDYEKGKKYPLDLYQIPPKKLNEANRIALEKDFLPNIYLKINKEQGEIKLDDYHIFKNIPKTAFDYKIGNKSPLEWVCSSFLPPKYDLTEENEKLLAEIDEYNWQEVKENLLDLIPRLVTMSLKTLEIQQQIDEK